MYDEDLIQVDVSGVSLTSTLQDGGYAVILKEMNGERRLPIIVGQNEAQSIAYQLEEISTPRPMTHDLIKIIIEKFGYEVDKVIIDELKDSTFYSKISFNDSQAERIDARPSDAIAIALRFSAPIYVTEDIMNEVGFVPTETKITGKDTDVEELQSDKDDKTPNMKLKRLQSELDEAIQSEDYEKAAMLRDEINKIDPQFLN
ncbi:hypothetical protein FBQ84_00470 [Ignavibacteria bacterium CHB1]|nr:MAG: hypothetical protein EDM69_00945 [Chlorobiota bacterium]MBV6398760.1 hypothetical protein [Ignavibacteria bacterium]MCC6885068.1 bifunctional nuclease family protein [Ignavibacteriales bacterium]MCE7952141.1 hypothetical protein [Chlorobi bacterium CHB7]MDL1886302.1 hypothetical protein [Ignavibacteria bacterium CHB1]RIK49457.1 MAG: hypothetical protein DCC60_03930 [Ignavibacteriota bacterium]